MKCDLSGYLPTDRPLLNMDALDFAQWGAQDWRRIFRMPPNRYESSLLKCPNCDACGALTIEKEAAPGAVTRRIFVAISGKFHVEVGRMSPDSAVVVCSRCDEIYDVLFANRNSR
jgi:hypothetical protein